MAASSRWDDGQWLLQSWTADTPMRWLWVLCLALASFKLVGLKSCSVYCARASLTPFTLLCSEPRSVCLKLYRGIKHHIPVFSWMGTVVSRIHLAEAGSLMELEASLGEVEIAACSNRPILVDQDLVSSQPMIIAQACK